MTAVTRFFALCTGLSIGAVLGAIAADTFREQVDVRRWTREALVRT